MKLRISIIALAASLLLNTGCSTVKTAYTGEEHSRFTNPAKIASMSNTQQQTLAPVAEAPESDAKLDTGWTAPNEMADRSTQPQFQTPSSVTPGAGSWGSSSMTR